MKSPSPPKTMGDLADTHCHIQSILDKSAGNTAKKWHDAGINSPDEVIHEAAEAGVNRLICVGTDVEDSANAAAFTQNRENCWAAIGVHPHEAKKTIQAGDWQDKFSKLLSSKDSKIVAIGEIGLDFYYQHSPKKDQIDLFEQLLQLASDSHLPAIFHVRDAYEDFWPVFDNFPGARGVLHSFSSGTADLEHALKRDLFVGLNGIMTFTRDQSQLEAAKRAPADKILLETDSPYLTPSPYRGKVCQPKHIKTICEFLCDLRGGSFDEFAQKTTQNAKNLFNID
jgi:TatD DNase family protein